ncbi:hypothetical protein AAFM46_16535 (plasmid) [Arthrobacter sp. TMP15]|uniref:hypothetical protein n=1 Tax=Arthrobacter sp. TMP15 TaxID=3140789 RepID=UPI0031B9C406
MTDNKPAPKRKITRVGQQYVAVGIVFLIAAVIFIFTMDSPGLWISFMMLGIVFTTSGATGAFEQKKKQ